MSRQGSHRKISGRAAGALIAYALLGLCWLQAQTPTGDAASKQPANKPAPSFNAAGIQGNIAPSGYSDGAREEEVRQVATLVVDLQAANLIDELPPSERLGCDRQAELLHAALVNPDSFEANRQLGLFYLQHGNPLQSAKYLAVARDKHPADTATAHDLATAEVEANDYAASSQLVSQLIAADPGDARAHYLKGSVEAAAGHVDAAVAEYKRSATLDPGANNVFSAGLSTMALGSFAEAETMLASATSAHPESAKLWLARGMVQILRDRRAQAIDSLLRSAALDPGNSLAPTILATLSKSAQTSIRILPVVEAFAAARPKEGIAHYDYALVLSKVDEGNADSKTRETIASELRAAIEREPKFAAAHFQLGVFDESVGDERSAIAEFVQAVSLQPDVAQSLYRLARAYRKAGQISLADSEMARFKELEARRDSGEDVSEKLIDGLPPDLLGVVANTCDARSAERYP